MVTSNTTTDTTALIEPPDHNPAVAAMTVRNQGFRIPGDTIHKAVEHMPDRDRNAILWFAGFCRTKNYGKSEMNQLLRKDAGGYYSYDSIYQAVTGRRTASGNSIEPIVEAIESLRKIEDARSTQTRGDFVETHLARVIWDRCHKALLRQRITFIFGDSQIGKTSALKEYALRNNHGQTTYLEAPTRATLGQFLRILADQMEIGTENKIDVLRLRIPMCFDSRRLLIVDEAHELLKASTKGGIDTLHWLRQLWNQRGCGIVLSMTNEGRDELLRGKFAKALEQLWRRRIQPLQLPNTPPQRDLALFAKQYGLEPAHNQPVRIRVGRDTFERTPRDLQDEVISRDGLGVWVGILQDASDTAKKQGRAITWGTVLHAYCIDQAECVYSEDAA